MLAEHRLNFWQAAQQHLRPTVWLGQHVGKVPAGEAGQPGLHLPRPDNAGDARCAKKLIRRYAKQHLDELNRAIRMGSNLDVW